MEAKCTLGVALCRFSGEVLIVAFKRRFRVVFVYTVSNKFAFTGKFSQEHIHLIWAHLHVWSFQIVRFVFVISDVLKQFENHRLVTR